MFDGEDFYPVPDDPVDQDIIGCNDRFAGVGDPTRTVHVRAVGEFLGVCSKRSARRSAATGLRSEM